MFKVFSHFKEIISPDYPLTNYYAYRQAEERGSDQRISTGWETILSGIVNGGFVITGTWPMRTERAVKVASLSANVLASSIVLVCRPRPVDAESINRREFLKLLKRELGPALHTLQQGSIAPVDLAQAAIGPGMAVFSRYNAVIEADGTFMPVRTALALINQALDEYLAEQEGEYDSDTRWVLAWFEQFGHTEAAFGEAETLSKAKNTSIAGLQEAGILEARAGKVRLYRRNELDKNWDPATDKRLIAWEVVGHLVYELENNGEESAAELVRKLGGIGEPARDLAYRLYTICERKNWAQDALGYNSLVVAWPRLKELASIQKPEQSAMF
jgi:putative DNA methylase